MVRHRGGRLVYPGYSVAMDDCFIGRIRRAGQHVEFVADYVPGVCRVVDLPVVPLDCRTPLHSGDTTGHIVAVVWRIVALVTPLLLLA